MAKQQMSKRERVMATLEGKPVDRPAYGFWGHHYDAEFSLASHVSSVLWWQRYLQMDFLKVQNRASYHVEDWGVRLRYPNVSPSVGVDYTYKPPTPAHERSVLEDYPIKSVEDWKKLRVLKSDEGALGERLVALRMIGAGLKEMGEDVPYLETVFTPLSIAARLVGWEGTDRSKLGEMAQYLREYPEAVHEALEVITQTFEDFAHACLKAGASGFLYATTNWASRDLVSEDEYAEFGRPYDLRVLEAMQDAECIILHVCQSHIMLFDLADYPVQAISWAPSDPGNPSLKEVWERLPDKTVVGGVSRAALAEPKPDRAVAEARQAFEDTSGLRWMAAPDCSVDPTCPVENMWAVAVFLQGLGG
jgi:uroporphyrinogen decarboxylase